MTNRIASGAGIAPDRRPARGLRQIGLTLVELMVAMAVGLILTLGVLVMLANASSAFRVQDDFARMQDGATSALRYLGESIRHAGFYGVVTDSTSIAVDGAVATANDCGSATNPPTANWALDVNVPLMAFDGLTAGTVNAMLPCIAPSNFLGGPVLVTRHAGGFRVPDPNGDGDLADGLAAQHNSAATIWVQSDPNQGLVFSGANFAALKAAFATPRLVTGGDAPIFEYKANVFYLRPCSRPTGVAGTQCQAGDDGGPIPTLVRQELVGNRMVEVALVEGIERIDLRFGIDTNSDGVPDRFSATPTAVEWRDVVAVRVAVLIRSVSQIAGYDDSGKSYDLDGDGVAEFTCTAGANCGFKRKVFTQQFQLKNVALRRGA